MEQEKRYPEPVETLVLVLFAFGVVFLFAIFGSVITSFISERFNNKYGGKFFYFAAGFLFLILPIIYIKFRQFDLKTVLRINPVPKRIIIHSIIIGISISILGDELDRLLQIVIPTPTFIAELVKNLVASDWIDWILLIFGAVVFASVSEELLFRGFMQVSLERKGDVTRAVLLSSISWTLFHLNPFWAIQIFIMGIVIGFLAWRTGSVIPTIIAHAINNTLSLIFLNFELEVLLEWYQMGEHVSPFILIPALALLIWSIREITFYYRPKY